MRKQTYNVTALLRYCVGIDVSKDSLQICSSTIDTSGKTTVKGTIKVANKVSAFDGLLTRDLAQMGLVQIQLYGIHFQKIFIPCGC